MREAAAIRTKSADEKFCIECGEVILAKAEICTKCGVRQHAPAAPAHPLGVAPNGKSRVVAALLAFFLGGFGAHKFYLGSVGMGIVYLLFFWTFIPAIAAFFEFIILLSMSDETFAQKHGGA